MSAAEIVDLQTNNLPPEPVDINSEEVIDQAFQSHFSVELGNPIDKNSEVKKSQLITALAVASVVAVAVPAISKGTILYNRAKRIVNNYVSK